MATLQLYAQSLWGTELKLFDGALSLFNRPAISRMVRCSTKRSEMTRR